MSEVILPAANLEIEVGSWLTEDEAADKYAETLVWLPTPGRQVHVGGGLWVTMCHECPAWSKTWGSQPIYSTIGPHEVAEHGAQVAGINVGLLPA